MEELKTLTEQVTEEQTKVQETPIEPVDNDEMLNAMQDQLMPHFNEALQKLSNNELRKLIKVLVVFPFAKVHKGTFNDKQKAAFMFGERIMYATMVKRAKAELVRTFGEVQKEQETKIAENVSVAQDGIVTLGTPGNEEQTHTITGEK